MATLIQICEPDLWFSSPLLLWSQPIVSPPLTLLRSQPIVSAHQPLGCNPILFRQLMGTWSHLSLQSVRETLKETSFSFLFPAPAHSDTCVYGGKVHLIHGYDGSMAMIPLSTLCRRHPPCRIMSQTSEKSSRLKRYSIFFNSSMPDIYVITSFRSSLRATFVSRRPLHSTEMCILAVEDRMS